ncbi:hypothetical protein PBI_JACE_70 [Gordonia phage Jace]|uniref:Uncharacterized protein n=1 Tax=Gordonia phage Jace TaxID=2182360 RepID=A0A2U8UJ96_9CAUD|nr:secreted protein [Gordonia phage Jace]AWN03690.1 hypothetical protein PBI_JACE_70 [Gordonia phage Jace]
MRLRRYTLPALLAVALVALPACSSMNQQDRVCTVHDKSREQHVSGSDGKTSTSYTNRVATSCGTFVVNDSIAGGYNSLDTFNALQVGHTYELRTGDYRVGFLDMFPNIIEIHREVAP